MTAQYVSVLVNGAMIGALYALIAIGFTMIFGVGGVLNLAHGALIMAGAYVFLFLSRDIFFEAVALDPILAFPLTILAVAGLSLALYAVLVRHVEEDVVVTFLATIVVAIAATELVVGTIGDQPYDFTVVDGTRDLLGATVTNTELLGFAVSWAAIGLLWYYVTNTDGGRSILATAMTERGAELTGVNVPFVRAKTWFIAGGLAGIAGVFLVGGDPSAQPLMWLHPLALAFIIVVIGGIGSIKGSIVAAYLVGYLETATVEFLGQGFRGILSLVVLVAVLLAMPQGLFGREFVHE